MPGLLDPSVSYRGGVLPYLLRTVTDPGDDITEYEQLEWALPGLLYEPLSGMAQTGGMLAGNVPVDPRVMTQTMLDAPLMGGLLASTTGMVPEGAVLGAFGKGSGAAHARPLNPTNRSLKGINDSPDDIQPPKVNPSASSRLPQHLLPKAGSGPRLTKEQYEDVYLSRSKDRRNWSKTRKAQREQLIDEIFAVKVDRGYAGPTKGQPPSTKAATVAFEDPLIVKSRTRPYAAEKLKKAKPYVDLGGGFWNKTFKDAVSEAAGNIDIFGRFAVNQAVDRANMEAVPRLLKKEGWTVRHGSKDRSGRKSSRYLVSPDKKFEVRLSDHDLPDTPERAYNREQFGGPQWNDEVILTGRDSPQSVIDEIKRLYSEGIELGANKGPTAALPGLLDGTASRMQRARDMGFDTDTTYYHGTTHDFDQFGGATGNVGGHFGAGHYATTSPIDASKNYAGVGPDLTGRIESRAERIAQEVMDDRGVSEEVANRYGRIVATRELKGQHEGAVLPLVARGKTADITGDNQTFLEYNYAGDFDEHLKDARADLGAKASDDEVLDRAYEYQDDYMMSNEPTGELADFIQGLRNQEQYYNFDADEVIGKINERAIDGGMTAMELDDLLRKSDSVMYAESMDTGDLVGNEIIRNAFNEAGFENIVMDASVAFPHMKNIPMGTKHIITSNPANLRSRFAKFDPAKADSADLLAANPITAAIPGLLDDQRGLSDFINYGGSDKRQHRGPHKVRGLLGDVLYEATTPDGFI